MDMKEIKTTLEKEKCELWSMLRDFYCETPLSVVILALFWSAIFIAGAVYCGIEFFRAAEVQQQIMYASVFVCFVFGVGLMKIFSWEIINRNRIERDIKHLELRISEWKGETKR